MGRMERVGDRVDGEMVKGVVKGGWKWGRWGWWVFWEVVLMWAVFRYVFFLRGPCLTLAPPRGAALLTCLLRSRAWIGDVAYGKICTGFIAASQRHCSSQTGLTWQNNNRIRLTLPLTPLAPISIYLLPFLLLIPLLSLRNGDRVRPGHTPPTRPLSLCRPAVPN